MLQGSLGVGAGSDEDEAAWGAAVAAVPPFSFALQTSFCPSLGQPSGQCRELFLRIRLDSS